MHIIFNTLDYSVMIIEIKDVYSELLDEHGYGLLRISLKKNDADIVSCEYEGYNMSDLLDTLKTTGSIDVDPKSFRVYMEFKAVVKYEDYKSLSELVTLNNIVYQSKNSKERENSVNITNAWEKLKTLE